MASKSLMQRLYESEINVTVASFWDGGFEVKIGDEMNGFDAKDQVKTWAEVEKWLRMKAVELYPDSKFAREEIQR